MYIYEFLLIELINQWNSIKKYNIIIILKPKKTLTNDLFIYS